MRGIFPDISRIEKDSKKEPDKIDFSSGFYTIPCVSLRNGSVCFCEDGKYVYPRNKKGKKIDPVDFLEEFESFPAVCLIDIDGISSNSQQLDLIDRIRTEADNEIWVDGGIRRTDDIFELVMKGADRVILSTKTIESLEEYKKALDNFENIIPGIDIYSGKVSSLSKEISSFSIKKLVLTLSGMGYRVFCLSDLGRDKSIFLENPEITELGRTGLTIFLNSEFEEEDREKVSSLGFRGMLIKTRGYFKGNVS